MTESQPTVVEEVLSVPIELIIPDPDQLRKWFDPVKLEDMRQSILSEGQKVPIEVAPANADGLYMIGDGERRWRGCKANNLSHMMVIIKEEYADPVKRHFAGLTANLHQESNTHLEIALALQRELDRHPDWTQEELGQKIGKSLTFVNQHLTLLKLDPQVRICTTPMGPIDKHIGFSTALIIARANLTPERQIAIMQRAANIVAIRYHGKIRKTNAQIPRQIIIDLIKNETENNVEPPKPRKREKILPEEHLALLLLKDLPRIMTHIDSLFDTISEARVSEIFAKLSPEEKFIAKDDYRKLNALLEVIKSVLADLDEAERVQLLSRIEGVQQFNDIISH